MLTGVCIGLSRAEPLSLRVPVSRSVSKMSSTIEILLPVFGLIAAGFLCRKRGVLGPAAASELNRFVVWLALPALLFQIMAQASWHQLYQPAFVATFALTCAAVFGGVLIWRVLAGRPLADASIDAIAASYPNTGYLGFPLCLLAFGTDSLTPTTIATILVACVLFAGAIVVIEIGLQRDRAPLRLMWKVVGALLRNPLIVAPLAGVGVAAAHVTLAAPAQTFLKLLGAAASPCALVSLGLFLAEKREASGDTPRGSIALTATKLFVQPALAWWLGVRVFALPPVLAQIAVVLAALPTGTGPYMLAEFYGREAQVTSRTILLSTIGSIVSLSVLLAFARHAS